MKGNIIYLILALLFFSCSNDDFNDHPEKNTTDIAVTGNVSEIGISSASITGYVNLNLLMGECKEIGVVYSLEEEPTKHNGSYEKTTSLVGNEFTVLVSDIDPEEVYYYRTYVYDGNIYHYGKTKSFSTSKYNNIISNYNVKDISYMSAAFCLTFDYEEFQKGYCSIGVAISETEDFEANTPNVIWRGTQKTESGTYELTITNLKENTKYYYKSYTRVNSKYYFSPEKSFDTKKKQEFFETQSAVVTNFNSARLTAFTKLKDIKPLVSNSQHIEYGFLYSTDESALEPNSWSSNRHIIMKNSSEVFGNTYSCDLEGLYPSKKYYYRAVCNIDYNYIYGDIKSFTTSDGAVDLGLSVKWASTNLGAAYPDATGSYFCWGELNHQGYNYWFEEYAHGYKEYMTHTSGYYERYYDIGENISGNPQYDIVTVRLGGKWRIPTSSEFNELLTRCVWSKHTPSQNYGANNEWLQEGWEVTGPSGKSIIFPATSGMGAKVNGGGYYWTANTKPGDNTYPGALAFVFEHDFQHLPSLMYYYKYYGLAIRPVCDK